MKEITLLQPAKIVFGTGCTEQFCKDYTAMGLKRLFILTAPVTIIKKETSVNNILFMASLF